MLGEVVDVAVWRCSRLLGESCLYPASAGGCRSLVPLLDSIPRAPVRPLFDDAPQHVAVVLVPSVHNASCRASVTAASDFRTITRAAGVASEPLGDWPGRRSRVKDPLLRHLRFFLTKLTWQNGVLGVGTARRNASSQRDSRPQIILGSKSI